MRLYQALLNISEFQPYDLLEGLVPHWKIRDDEQTAKKMSQDLNGALLGLQFLVNSRAQNDDKFALLMDVVRTLRITNQGSNIVIRGTISPETIDKAKKKLPQ